MKRLIENFTLQLDEAITIGKKSKITFTKKIFNQVVISGLGGSGIGGTIIQDYVFDKLSIPFVVNKNYFIPKSVTADTLFIACSYSGNTEETISAVKEAKKRKANIVCITSGGELANFATKNKLPLILVPGGNPPRASLGYSLVQILFVLNQAKLINTSFIKEIESSISLINKETKKIQTNAVKIANQINGKQVAIYTNVGHEGIAIRFRQQLNENSKQLAWTNVIPEMTHNEIIGWKKEHKELAILYCAAKSDYERNLRRMKVLKEVTKKYKATLIDIDIKGNSFFEQVFLFVHLTDWISVCLSDLTNTDPVEVNVLDLLKSNMAKK
jgi:glucose/mannose-6-phosphate isomerase